MSEHDGFEPSVADQVAVDEPHDLDADLDVDLDPDAPAEDVVSEGVDGDEPQDEPEDEGADGEVLVLDTWQIQLPATGDAAVDAALARLTEVEGLAPAAHSEVYEAVHTGLQEALADLDRG